MDDMSNYSEQELFLMWQADGRSDSLVSHSDREHAFWEYWRRVGFGEACIDEEIFETAIASHYSVVPDVIAELAVRNKLSSCKMNQVIREVCSSDPRRYSRAISCIEARKAINEILDGKEPLQLIRKSMLDRGLSWAVLEVVGEIDVEAAREVVEEIEYREVFTKHQRHLIRTAIGRHR